MPDPNSIQRVIDAGEVLDETKTTLVYVLEDFDSTFMVKATRTDRTVSLESFRRLSSREVRREPDLQRFREKRKKGPE